MTRPTAPHRRCFVLSWSLATGLASAACQVETRGAAGVGLGPEQGVELDATPTDAAPPPRADADAPPDANPDAMPEPFPPDAALPAGPLCLPGQFPAFGGVLPRCGRPPMSPDVATAGRHLRAGAVRLRARRAARSDRRVVHVGLPECDDAFKDATGRCRPRFASCPPGTRPDGSSACISTEADTACDETAWARFADNADHVVVAPDGDDTTADGTRAHPIAASPRASRRSETGTRSCSHRASTTSRWP
jgi:hypothetical protein